MADDFDDVILTELEEAFRRSQASMQQVFTRGFDRLEDSLLTIIQRIDTMVRVKHGLSAFSGSTSSVEQEIDLGTQACLLFTVEENKTEELSGSNLNASNPNPEFEVYATEAVELLTSDVHDSSRTTTVMLLPSIKVPADASKSIGNFLYPRLTKRSCNPQLDNPVNKFFQGFMVFDNRADGRLKDDSLHDTLGLVPSIIKPEVLGPFLPLLLCSIKDYTLLHGLIFDPGMIFDPGIAYYTLMAGSQFYEFSTYLQHSYGLSLYCWGGDTLDLFMWVVNGIILRLVFDPGTFNSTTFSYLNCSGVGYTVWIYPDSIFVFDLIEKFCWYHHSIPCYTQISPAALDNILTVLVPQWIKNVILWFIGDRDIILHSLIAMFILGLMYGYHSTFIFIIDRRFFHFVFDPGDVRSKEELKLVETIYPITASFYKVPNIVLLLNPMALRFLPLFGMAFQPLHLNLEEHISFIACFDKYNYIIWISYAINSNWWKLVVRYTLQWMLVSSCGMNNFSLQHILTLWAYKYLDFEAFDMLLWCISVEFCMALNCGISSDFAMGRLCHHLAMKFHKAAASDIHITFYEHFTEWEYFIAYLEPLAISNFPSYQFVDHGVMYKVGSLFSAIYFIVSFPMFLRIGEKSESKWELPTVAVDALGSTIMVQYPSLVGSFIWFFEGNKELEFVLNHYLLVFIEELQLYGIAVGDWCLVGAHFHLLLFCSMIVVEPLLMLLTSAFVVRFCFFKPTWNSLGPHTWQVFVWVIVQEWLRYFGPFRILERAGSVAYRLELPPHVRILPVFHVSLLKRFVGDSPTSPTIPVPLLSVPEDPITTPSQVLDTRLVRINDSWVKQVLIRWDDSSSDTWELASDTASLYPSLDLEDKVQIDEEGNVMNEEEVGLAGNNPRTENEIRPIRQSERVKRRP